MTKEYPRLKNQYYIRFSDKVYFKYSLQGKLHIICKLGEQYYLDCIQENKKPNKKNKKRYHCWATLGNNFKSDIYFYKVPKNTNEKISQKIYINQIFLPIIKLQIKVPYDFILKEDSDLSHKSRKSNIVHTQKKTKDLDFYFNYYSLSDLILIKNSQQSIK